MVQIDLGPLAVSKSKENPVDDPLRHDTSGCSSSQHLQTLPQPRLGLAPIVQLEPISPAQSTTGIPTSTYASHHPLGNGGLQSHSAYGVSPQESSYYTSHSASYTPVTSSHPYPSSGPSDLMATTAQMQRPSYPPIYHTPQSNSPASVASQPHDQHGRSMYSQSPQMPPQMYGYPPYSPMNPVQPSPYAAHPSPQSHPLTSQSMMMPPQTTTAQMSPHQPSHAATSALPSSNPVMKMEPSSQSVSAQRPMLNPPLPSPVNTNAGLQAGVVHQTSPIGTSSSAAPGPIPATTPQVVRQDSNGVQWIAFEYSRDRVKMEYTIRCDVESVNVDELSQEFKTENCVYPRACCNKDQYRGNRLVYETECNTVGWALAQLNPTLRGKRGLIQRAVDSWRNSNQDPRLRSRRVRRQAKVNYRNKSMAPSTPHMTAAGPMGPNLSSTPTMPGPQGTRHGLAGPGPMSMGPPQLHHHHAQPNGSPKIEEVNGTPDYTNAPQRHLDSARLPSAPLVNDIRSAQVFHEATTVPTSTSTGPSMPPLLRDNGLGTFGRHHTIATSSNTINSSHAAADDNVSPTNDDLFRQLPDGKRRTFILVEDPQRGARVRVKVMLDKVNMDEIPDSYRKDHAVYPRTYFPVQMKDAPGTGLPHKRFARDDTEQVDEADATVGRTSVLAPSLDGEREVDVPLLSRRRHRNEVLLNDLGYRLSWSQSRVFAGRMLFLQRSLDAYRNKMRSSMLAAGQDPSEIPDHFDTRRGKRRFLERRARRLEMETRAGPSSTSQRSVEEVEG